MMRYESISILTALVIGSLYFYIEKLNNARNKLKRLTSTVGLPLESRISRALTAVIVDSDDILRHDELEAEFPILILEFGVTKARELPKESINQWI